MAVRSLLLYFWFIYRLVTIFINYLDHTHTNTHHRVSCRNNWAYPGSKTFVCHRQMRKQGTKMKSRNSGRYVRKRWQTKGKIFRENRQHRLFIQSEDYRVHILSRIQIEWPNANKRKWSTCLTEYVYSLKRVVHSCLYAFVCLIWIQVKGPLHANRKTILANGYFWTLASLPTVGNSIM